jgi:GNAT superfamily N-acetyltransferase
MAQFLSFMSATMPGDWVEDARNLLKDMTVGAAPADSIFVATDEGKIVGYCKFVGEHFGPFGVADSHQGRGVGTLLLARTLHQMRKEGHHAAYVLWTGERAAKGVYARLGFTVSRRFALLRKALE